MMACLGAFPRQAVAAVSRGRLALNRPPSITAQPQSQTVNVGATAAFTVNATGTAPILYQWRFNGNNLPGMTNATLTLRNVQLLQAGNYSVRVNNAFGSVTSAEARLTVNVPSVSPTITRQPQNQTVAVGANVTFNVLATGTPPLQYQWRFNTRDLAGRTNATLTLANVQLTNAGIYSVRVSNSGGTVTSADARLTVNVPSVSPAITRQPQNQTVAVGANVTFSILATGTPPLQYQWRFNGIDLPGATTATLVITNVQAANAGIYSARVSNAGGSVTSSEARLSSTAPSSPPRIIRQPQNQTVAIGTNAVFTVLATGTQPLRYQWLFEGRDLAGATNALLVITNVQPPNAGDYSVRVSNSGGSVTSAEARLTPGVPPTITQPPRSLTATSGSSATFSVTATGTPPLSYQWRFNGQNLIASTNSTLELKKVQLNNAGNYSVRVSNPVGSVLSAEARLTVNIPSVPPIITRQPQSQSAAAGASVAFSVAATGTLPLQYQWRINGRDLIGATNDVLRLANVQSTNAGNYSVRVSNVAGAVVSVEAQLKLIVPPAIVRQPENRTTLPGGTVSFGVIATGTAPMSYQWFLDGRALGRATNALLVITNVQSANAGAYTVRVSNSVGSATSSQARLTLNVAPRILTQPQSQAVTRSATASFRVVASGTEPLRYQWRFNGRDVAGGTNAALVLNNVQQTNSGSYSVLVANVAGVAASAEAKLVLNLPPTILKQPQDREVTPGNAVIFQVFATGTPPLRYQWRLGDRALPGATNALLVLTNVQPANAGEYRVEVLNAVGAVLSDEAELDLNLPPVIQTHPTNQTASIGSSVVFSVLATGDPPLIYQWLRNGDRIRDATNAVFTISNVPLTNAATYTVVVVNRAGATTSRKAILNITVPALTLSDDFAASLTNVVAAGNFEGGSNRNASREAGEPLPAGKRGGKSVWFTWQPPASGIATFSTLGSDFDTLLAVYTGDRINNLKEVASDDDRGGFKASAVTFNAVAGTAYRIAIDGHAGAVGRIVVSWRLQATVQQIPRIASQPASQTVRVGTDVTFSVSAESSQPLAFQWLRNGTRIPGATATNLVIRNARERDAGRYTVLVSSDLSGQFAFLSVESLPAILQINAGDPEPEKVASRDKFLDLASLSAGGPIGLLNRPARTGAAGPLSAARGYSGAQIFDTFGATKDDGEPNHCDEIGGASQWFLYQAPTNGVLRISTEGSDFNTVLAVYTGPGTDFATLLLEACNNDFATNFQYSLVTLLVTADVNYYVAVDGVGGVQGHVELNYDLGLPPRITAQPLSQAVVAGTNATLSVVAVNPLASVPLAYQWRRDDLDAAGATNSVLILTNVQPTAAGNYGVVITNVFGAVTSLVAAVTINVPIAITSPLQDQAATVGSTAVFAVSANGTEPLAYQWLLNGGALPGETNATLTLIEVQPANSGNYQVVVSNPAGVVTSPTASLTVSAPPVITTQPQSTNVVMGTTVILAAGASGAPPLSYQWRLESENIAGATNSSLVLPSIQVSMAGEYTVIVSNAFGSAESEPSQVAVGLPVTIISPPQNQTAASGTSVIFSVSAIGTEPLLHQWQFNGVNLPLATNATLTLPHVQAANAGTYTVVVSNPFSSATSDAADLTLVGDLPISLSYGPSPAADGFVIRITGSAGENAELQTSSDLITWQTLANLSLTAEPVEYFDADAAKFPTRFYRAVARP